jgi:hypothetical protein
LRCGYVELSGPHAHRNFVVPSQWARQPAPRDHYPRSAAGGYPVERSGVSTGRHAARSRTSAVREPVPSGEPPSVPGRFRHNRRRSSLLRATFRVVSFPARTCVMSLPVSLRLGRRERLSAITSPRRPAASHPRRAPAACDPRRPPSGTPFRPPFPAARDGAAPSVPAASHPLPAVRDGTVPSAQPCSHPLPAVRDGRSRPPRPCSLTRFRPSATAGTQSAPPLLSSTSVRSLFRPTATSRTGSGRWPNPSCPGLAWCLDMRS